MAQPKQQPSLVVAIYNEWLKAQGLSKYIIAHKFDKEPGTANGGTLVLLPVGEYEDPERFAAAWSYLKAGTAKHNIDLNKVLLNKLANYFPGENKLQIKIALRTTNPEMFSLKLSFDVNKEVIADEVIAVSRGGNGTTGFDFDAAAINMSETCVRTKPLTAEVVTQRLNVFFKKYKHAKNNIRIEPVIGRDKKKLSFSIYNVYGQITGKNLNELIYLDIDIDNGDLCYTVDALYAPGIFKAPDPVSESRFYHPIMPEFPQQWMAFKDDLHRNLSKLFNEQ